MFHAIIPNSSTYFEATLYDQKVQYVGEIVNTSGAPEQSVAVTIPADGVYLIQVHGDGDWTVEVQQ